RGAIGQHRVGGDGGRDGRGEHARRIQCHRGFYTRIHHHLYSFLHDELGTDRLGTAVRDISEQGQRRSDGNCSRSTVAGELHDHFLLSVYEGTERSNDIWLLRIDVCTLRYLRLEIRS